MSHGQSIQSTHNKETDHFRVPGRRFLPPEGRDGVLAMSDAFDEHSPISLTPQRRIGRSGPRKSFYFQPANADHVWHTGCGAMTLPLRKVLQFLRGLVLPPMAGPSCTFQLARCQQFLPNRVALILENTEICSTGFSSVLLESQMCEEKANWQTLYREALQEHDLSKMAGRVAEAQQAMRRRALELWYAGTPDTTERRQMDAASHHLRLLCTIGVSK